MTPLGSLTPIHPQVITPIGIPLTPTQLRHEALVPQAQAVAAIDTRFCEPCIVTLQEKLHMFKVGCTFQDVSTGAVRYEIKSKAFTSRHMLVDASDTPIMNYISKAFSMRPVLYVHAGNEHHGPDLFQIYVKYNYMSHQTVLRVDFSDVTTRHRYTLSFTGDWPNRNASIWLDKRRGGNRELVAKVYCPDGVGPRHYHVDIAPNMDTALITAVCSVLAKQENIDERIGSSG